MRELSPDEVRRLLRKPNSGAKVYDPVTYRGMPVAKSSHVRRFTLQRTVTKEVNEEDATILLRSGWEIVSIYDPDDDE